MSELWSEEGCGITRKMSFEEIVELHTFLSFEGIVGPPNVYQFNKGGNCKLQGGLFIFIEKFSMGIFNIGGNCKLQLPQMKGGCVTLHLLQMKFVLVIPHPPLHCLNERQEVWNCNLALGWSVDCETIE